MAAANPIEVVLVGQVVKVELEIDVLRDRIRSHRIERPIRIHEACVDGVAETTIDKPRTATEMKTGRQTIGGPHVERISRRVDEFLSDFRGNV